MPDDNTTSSSNNISRLSNRRHFRRLAPTALNQLQLDAGVIITKEDFDPVTSAAISADDILCATSGGIQVSATPSMTYLGDDIDNCPSNMMELTDIESWACEMSFTALDVSEDIIKVALGASSVTSHKIVPNSILTDENFQSNLWWIGDKSDGGFIAVHLLNALSTSGFSLQTTKAGKGQLSVTLTGYSSAADYDESTGEYEIPIEIYSIDSEDAVYTSGGGGGGGATGGGG